MKKSILFLLGALVFGPHLIAIETDGQWIEEYITTVPDFPKPGIQFKCYPHLLQNPEAFHRVIKTFADRYRDSDLTAIVGLDSRGFIFGTALAYEMQLPFVMVRKAGKLPRKVEKIDYELEYGTSSFEIEVDSIKRGDRVLIVDDLLATGGTAAAAATLIERLGGQVVEVACLIELEGLHGRENLARPFYSLISIKVDEISDADTVRQARLDQNEAMANGDVERAAAFWTDDVTLRRGLGASTIGKDAYRALLDTAPNEKSLIYVREPDLIEISPDWPLAYESGRWTARRGSRDGPVVITGRYSAQWIKREGDWLIRSEIFVALTCSDDACSWLAVP
jgi:adenine phosphoribosyltransferase